MFRIPYLLLVFVCAFVQARPITLAWDNPGWPVGTTVELEANGVTVSGITGTQATLDVPLVPGEGLFARARAHADGLDPSEWAALTVTYPRDPVAVWADRTEPDLTPVAISNPVLLGQGSANGVNSYNVTLGTNPSAGDLIVVMMVFADTTSSVGDSAVSDNKGHTYTRQTQSAHYLYSGYYARSEIWTTVCTTTGGTFTVTIDPPVTSGMYSSAAVTGISGQATSFVDTAESSTGTSSSPSANIANLTDAGDLVLGVMTYNWYGVTIAPGSGWTQLVEIDEQSSTYQALSAIWRKPGATGAYDPAWTISGGGPGWEASGIAILPSAGGTPGNATPSGVSSTGSIGTAVSTGAASKTPTGVSSTGSYGTAVGTGAASISISGVSGSGELGTAVAEGAHSGLPDGVSATGSVGDVLASGAANILSSGIEATSGIGTSIGSGAATTTVDGVSANAELGDVIGSAPVTVEPTGVSATSAVGDVVTVGAANVEPNGVESTASITNPVSTGSAIALPEGVSANAELGDVVAEGPDNALPDGVTATSAVGDVIASGAGNALPDGIYSTGQIGDVEASGGEETVAYPTGVEATGSVGTAIVTGKATINATGSEANSAVGTVIGSGSANVISSGVSSESNIGTVVSTGAANILSNGISAEGLIGDVIAVGGGSAIANPVGVSSTGAIGTVIAIGGATVAPDGLEATAVLGLAVGSGAGQALITGISALSEISNPEAFGAATVTVTGVSAEALVGTPRWLETLFGYYGTTPIEAAYLGETELSSIRITN